MDMALISGVIIGSRRRSCDKDKVNQLSKSIEQLGLLNPITITSDYVLVAGAHRLAACKLLGWVEVPVNIIKVDGLYAELAEIDENLVRNELTYFEQSRQLARRKEIYEVLYPETKIGTAQAVGMNKKLGYNVSDKMTPTFAKDTADKVGVSERTIERKVAIGKALEPIADRIKDTPIANSQTDLLSLIKTPEDKKEAVIKKIESGEANSVKDAQLQIKTEERIIAKQERIEVASAVERTNPLLNHYNVIYADPAWQYDMGSEFGYGRTAQSHYDTMSLEDMIALGIGKYAADNCVLLMWATWPKLDWALELGKAWGFEYITCAFVWAKTNKNVQELLPSDNSNWFMGMGFWSRSNTEVCLLFKKGKPERLVADVRQLVVAPIGEHSQKPDEVYSRIERLLDGPYLEVFARRKYSDDWDVWGNEI